MAVNTELHPPSVRIEALDLEIVVCGRDIMPALFPLLVLRLVTAATLIVRPARREFLVDR
jgi:hypothetical protein